MTKRQQALGITLKKEFPTSESRRRSSYSLPSQGRTLPTGWKALSLYRRKRLRTGYATPPSWFTPNKGERCFGKRNWQAKGRINVIGALYNQALLAPYLYECNIDGEIFHQWISDGLLPKLPKGAVVIMDNAAFHKRQATYQMLAQAGMLLEYLPAYSPVPNPIEHTWAQAKALRRKYRCSVDELFSCHLK